MTLSLSHWEVQEINGLRNQNSTDLLEMVAHVHVEKHQNFHLQTLGPFFVVRGMQRTQQAAGAGIRKSPCQTFFKIIK